MQNKGNKNYYGYKNLCFYTLGDYGEVGERKEFEIEIKGKNRKYPIIITNQTKIDLVQTLKEITGYSFFFFENEKNGFYARKNEILKWKKEVYYDPKEIEFKSFMLDLLHEVVHFPECIVDDLEHEKKTWIEAIQLAKIFKNNYNVCFLAGFKGHNQIYQYINNFIKTYKDL